MIPTARSVTDSRPSGPAVRHHTIRHLMLGAVLLLPLLGGCGSKDDADKDTSAPTTVPVETLYNNGIDALQARRYTTAIDQFNAVQQNYPFSTWAPSAQLMVAYAQYLQNHYSEALTALDGYIKLHPASRDVPYAYYLRALCYYEQITDISREQKGTQDAMTALQEVVDRFPGTTYARDARLKIDLCRDHIAGANMEIGRWYENQHMYTAAIGRFQRVVDDYQTTNQVPEALHRLVEIYLILGLKDEAKRTAAVLGYNYPGNIWYADTYDQLRDVGLVEGAPVPSDVGSGQGFFSRAWHSIF
jgi:outer membrane protein assembly factor BamD